MSYTAWSVIAGETPTATKWNLLGGNDADFDSRLTDLEDKRITAITSSATPTPNSDTTDIFEVTALATNPTFAAPSGTPIDGRTLLVRIKDNGSARTLAFNSIYRFSTDIPAPTTTIAGLTMYLAFVYNSADSKWDCVAIINGF